MYLQRYLKPSPRRHSGKSTLGSKIVVNVSRVIGAGFGLSRLFEGQTQVILPLIQAFAVEVTRYVKIYNDKRWTSLI